MTSFRFGPFLLDCRDRQLRREGAAVELNARYFDALALLVREGGTLVSKDRFLSDVWRGVPVTDEALTQCVRTLRRALGDDAASPRFIETVPKHGYRFVAAVEPVEAVDTIPAAPAAAPKRADDLLLLGAAGTLGGGAAGLAGGLFYGFASAAEPAAPGVSALSVLLVLVVVTTLVALVGAAGVAFGIAAAERSDRRWAVVAGGALGGLVVGAVVKLLGLDAFALLVGQSPGEITGAAEGLVLGGAAGLGAWLGHGRPLRHAAVLAALAGGAAGIVIPLGHGRLMGGSLASLAGHFPHSRLRLDGIGRLVGEGEFGLLSRMVTGGLEGALFAACITAAMLLARRHLTSARSGSPAAPPPRDRG